MYHQKIALQSLSEVAQQHGVTTFGELHCHAMFERHPATCDNCHSPQGSCQTPDPNNTIMKSQHY